MITPYWPRTLICATFSVCWSLQTSPLPLVMSEMTSHMKGCFEYSRLGSVPQPKPPWYSTLMYFTNICGPWRIVMLQTLFRISSWPNDKPFSKVIHGMSHSWLLNTRISSSTCACVVLRWLTALKWPSAEIFVREQCKILSQTLAIYGTRY